MYKAVKDRLDIPIQILKLSGFLSFKGIFTISKNIFDNKTHYLDSNYFKNELKKIWIYFLTIYIDDLNNLNLNDIIKLFYLFLNKFRYKEEIQYIYNPLKNKLIFIENNKDLGNYKIIEVYIGVNGRYYYNLNQTEEVDENSDCYFYIVGIDNNISNFRNIIKQKYSNREVIYQSFGNVYLDLEFIIARSCIDRLFLLKQNFINFHLNKYGNKNILDLGGNIGFFTRDFEYLGFNVDIIENNLFNIGILNDFKIYFSYNYNIINNNILDVKLYKHYNTVIAFSILHHFLKNKTNFDKLYIFLDNLKTSNFIIELHNIGEKQMEGAYKNFNELEFIDFLMKRLNLYNVEKIGETDFYNRTIYRLF